MPCMRFYAAQVTTSAAAQEAAASLCPIWFEPEGIAAGNPTDAAKPIRFGSLKTDLFSAD